MGRAGAGRPARRVRALAGRPLCPLGDDLVRRDQRAAGPAQGRPAAHGREIRLDSLTDISCSQSLTDRLLRCGDILLESPGRDSQEVFPDLPHPVSIQNEIYRLLNQRRGAGAAVPGKPPTRPAGVPAGASGGAPAGADVGGRPVRRWPPGSKRVADQLSQLDDLRRRGVISRREFAAKKAELLSRM